MKVGDYVRFKDKRGNTYIRKIIDLPQDIRYGAIEIDIETNYSNMLSPKNIIKSSPNIVDLIEVGDYVDKLRVVDKYENYIVVETFDERIVITKEDTIKSIVTKEQFEVMQYEIK